MGLMDIREFLTSPKQAPVVLFRAPSVYPSHFFFWLLSIHKKSYPCQILELDDTYNLSVKATIQTTFLGQSYLYWLRNVSDIAPKARTDLLSFLQQYQGPNCVWLFAYDTDITQIGSSWQEVVLPDEMNQKMIVELARVTQAVPTAHLPVFISLLSATRKSMLFDELFMLQRYLHLLGGKQLAHFVDEWLGYLMADKASLFVLSKYFFAKDTRSFFVEWHKNVGHYSEQFWSIYWADQVWRATTFITLARKNQRAQAKQLAYKLPFTFLQSDWHNYSVRELKAAHAFLYDFDAQAKSGGTALGLDLFFSTFFAGQF
jgi:hypothetical protein